MTDTKREAPASPEKRAAALELVLRRKADMPKNFVAEFPEHHRNLVVLENTATVHNVIVCNLCSCTAYTITGAAPDWYKDLDYRARVVRESRTVLREIGLDLPATIEIRVRDTTTDIRYTSLEQVKG